MATRSADSEPGVLVHEGELSTVWLARRDDEEIIFKSYDRVLVESDPSVMNRVLRERQILEKCYGNDFIVSFLFAESDPVCVSIGMEHVGGGDLFSLLGSHGAFEPAHARCYVGELALALAHIHSLDIMHRDVKPENVLVALDGHVKLADFGCAKVMVGRKADAPPPSDSHTLIGTPEYMPPEVFLGAPSNETADNWSLGCLACELLCGVTPFSGFTEAAAVVTAVLVSEIVLPQHANLGDVERDFLLALLTRDPDERLGARPHGARSLLRHAWFADAGVTEAALLAKHVAPWAMGGQPSAEPAAEPSAVEPTGATSARAASAEPPKPANEPEDGSPTDVKQRDLGRSSSARGWASRASALAGRGRA